MSLDVTLYGKPKDEECFNCGHVRPVREALFEANITHNLNAMADEAGIYMHLWRPDEIGIKCAGQLVEPLKNALDLLKIDRARFEKFNPPNGWGSYDGFVDWVEEYFHACIKYPLAEVHASR